MKLLDIFESRAHPKRLNLVETDQIRIGMSSYDVDFNDQGGRITLDVTQQGMTVAELVYESGEIVWIHVEPWFRKQGLAEAMLGYLRGRGLKVVMPDARTSDGQRFFRAMQQRGKLDEVESIGDLDDSDHALDTQQITLTPGAKPVARFGDVDMYQDDPQHFVFFQGERPVGFAHGHRGPHPDLGNWITIGLIWLDPSVRKKRVGTQFYEWLLGQNLVVISDTHQSDTAQVVWEKLVQKYEAALLHDGAVAKMITSYSDLRDGYDVYSDEDETEVTIAVFPRRRTTPLMAESLTEDDGEFDWTKPTTLYRGVVDPAHAEKPFSGTRLGVPTFTDNWHIANIYATSANNKLDRGKSDQVYAYRLNIKNPIHLNEGREDVTEANHILPKLGITDVDQAWAMFQKLYAAMVEAGENSWRCNGETFLSDGAPYQIEGIDDGNGFAFPDRTYKSMKEVFYEHWAHNWPGLYCTSFNLANSTTFQEMARRAGFDGILMYGYNSVPEYADDEDIMTGTSFNGHEVLEWRALYPSQVEFLGPAGDPRSITEALNSPVRFNISHNSDSRYANYNFSYNGEDFRVGFKDAGDAWNVVFVNVNQDLPFDPTGLGGGIPVLSTVIAIVKDFITLYPQVKTLRFSGENHNGLADLYRQMVRTLSKRLGIRFEEDRLQYQSQFLVHLRETVQHSDQIFEQLYAAIYRDRTFSRETSTDLDDFIGMIEDEYEEILWWKPGTPNVLETPEWWYGFRIWLGKRYQYVVKNIQSEIGGYPVILNREMTVTANWNPDKHGLGVYWATAGGEIHAFSGKEGPGYQIAWMTAEVQESDINWFDTIRSRLDFATGDEEQEIQLKPNVKIKLIDIDVSRPAYKSEGVKINVRPGVYPTTGMTYESITEGPAVPLRVTPRMIARAKDNKCQIIVEMPIQQFLDMTTPDQPAQQRIASNSKSILDYNRWAKMANDPAVAKRFNDQRQQKHTGEEPYEPEYGNDLMPFLLIRLNNNGSSGWVVGHEGRHRGSASMKAGAKTMQVSLRIYPGEDMFPDQYSPDYFITQEHLPSHLVGQFNKDVYPTGGWKIIDGDLQKRTRERILR